MTGRAERHAMDTSSGVFWSAPLGSKVVTVPPLKYLMLDGQIRRRHPPTPPPRGLYSVSYAVKFASKHAAGTTPSTAGRPLDSRRS